MVGRSIKKVPFQESAPEVLGILVSSDSHWDDVFELTRAAKIQGRAAVVFLSGKGVLLVSEPLFESISENAVIYLCRKSCKTMNLDIEIKKIDPEQIVSSDKNIEIIETSDRYLVF